MKKTHLYEREFGFDYDMPAEIVDLIDHELIDFSFHHDIAPSFVMLTGANLDNDQLVRLWVNPLDPAERESDYKRFVVCADDTDFDGMFQTDDVQDALDALRKRTVY